MKNINKILVISLSNIGDVILTLPVVGVLREEFPMGNISILVGRRAYEAVKENPEFFEVIIYDKRKTFKEKLLFIRSLRRKQYDMVVDLRHSLFPLFLGAKNRSPLFFRKAEPGEHRVKKTSA